MTHLAEAYIHFKPFNATDREIRSLGEFAQSIGTEVAGEIYGGDVIVRIELEEGSLKTRMAIVGSITLGIYSGVANYKGFKESVVAMCDDARDFSIDVCKPFTLKAGVPVNDIFRFERRLKTPGKLYRIAKRLEKLERSISELAPKDVQSELASLRGELDSAADDLSANEMETIEKALRRPKLPPPKRWPQPEPAKVISRREEEEELPLSVPRVHHHEVAPNPRIVFQSTTEVPKQRRLHPRRSVDDSQTFLEE